MKIIFLCFLLFLLSCTSKSEIEDTALEAAKANFKSLRLRESEQTIRGKESLKKTLVEVLLNNSEFEIEKVTSDDNRAKVVVHVKTIPSHVRQKLMGVVEHLESWKDSKFNMSDALGLVRQEMHDDSFANETFVVELKKSDHWQVVE